MEQDSFTNELCEQIFDLIPAEQTIESATTPDANKRRGLRRELSLPTNENPQISLADIKTIFAAIEIESRLSAATVPDMLFHLAFICADHFGVMY